MPLLEKVTITDVAAEGKALARVDEMVVFVPFVAPGDVVDIQLTRKKHSYAEGKAVHFHQYAEQRAVPFCEHFGVCGGCKWQHLPYEEQLKYKQKQVVDNLTRIGKVPLGEVLPILGSARTQFYRNKLEFTFSNKKWLTEEQVQSGETFDMTYTERYTPFPQLGKKDLSVELNNIPAEKCMIKEQIINQEYGSAFDKWLEMGACELDKEDIEYLKNASAPKITKYAMDITDNTLKLSFLLSPLEVRLIEIFLQ